MSTITILSQLYLYKFCCHQDLRKKILNYKKLKGNIGYNLYDNNKQ